jgi:Ca2+/H+ antiporter, TMEM165/GDT1 family
VIPFYWPALLVAFLVTLLELTEVVVLVFALSADHHTVSHGAAGAVGGTAVVGAAALAFGAALIALPRSDLLWASAVVLAGFGAFLFRSTVKSYRKREAARASGGAAPAASKVALQFAGGFSVGAVESTEVVVVLLALTAAGYGAMAILGAVSAAALLVVATFLLREKVRRIKVPWLKLGATSMLFSFAVFWAGEAAGFTWPGSDLFLIPLFLAGVALVRGGVEVVLRRGPRAGPPAPA